MGYGGFAKRFRPRASFRRPPKRKPRQPVGSWASCCVVTALPKPLVRQSAVINLAAASVPSRAAATERRKAVPHDSRGHDGTYNCFALAEQQLGRSRLRLRWGSAAMLWGRANARSLGSAPMGRTDGTSRHNSRSLSVWPKRARLLREPTSAGRAHELPPGNSAGGAWYP